MWVFLYILIKRKKDILILGEGSTQGLHDATLIAEKKYSINFTEFSLHYTVMEQTVILGKLSRDFSVDNMKKTGLDGHVYDFSVDYEAIAVNGILEIYKYLIKKSDMN